MDFSNNFFMLDENWDGLRVSLRDLEFLHELPCINCDRCGEPLWSTANEPYITLEARRSLFGDAEAVSRAEFDAKIAQLPIPDAYRNQPLPPAPGVGIDRIHVYCSGVLPDITEIYGCIIVSPRAREILHIFGAVDDHFTELIIEKGPDMPGHTLFCPPMTVIGKADWRPYTRCAVCGRTGIIEEQLQRIEKYKASPENDSRPPAPLPPNPGIVGWKTSPFTTEFWKAIGKPHFFRLFAHRTYAAYSTELIEAFRQLDAVAVTPKPVKLIGYKPT